MKKSKKCIVVFKQSGHWTQLFLKKGFGHCFCFIQEGDYFLQYEKVKLGIVCNQIKLTLEELLKSQDIEGYTKRVVDFELEKFVHSDYLVLNCVSLVKHALDIKSWFVLTPYQLFKYLNLPR